MSDDPDPSIDANNHELTMVDGAVIERDYVYIAQYPDMYRDYWDEMEATTLSTVDLSDSAGPWMAHNVNLKIVSVCVWQTYPHVKRLYVALASDGRVHMVGPAAKPTIDEAVPGAVQDDVSGRPSVGLMNQICAIGTSLYACGYGRQVYRRKADSPWLPIHGDMLVVRTRGAGMDSMRLLAGIGGLTEESIYVCGIEGEVFFFDGKQWTRIPTDTTRALHKLVVDPSGTVYIVGQGVLLGGDHARGFATLVNHPQNFTGIALYDDVLYIASTTNLYTYSTASNALRTCRTGLQPELVDCHRLDAYDGVLWSFGSKDLAFFDGTNWTRVQHPDNEPI